MPALVRGPHGGVMLNRYAVRMTRRSGFYTRRARTVMVDAVSPSHATDIAPYSTDDPMEWDVLSVHPNPGWEGVE